MRATTDRAEKRDSLIEVGSTYDCVSLCVGCAKRELHLNHFKIYLIIKIRKQKSA